METKLVRTLQLQHAWESNGRVGQQPDLGVYQLQFVRRCGRSIAQLIRNLCDARKILDLDNKEDAHVTSLDCEEPGRSTIDTRGCRNHGAAAVRWSGFVAAGLQH